MASESPGPSETFFELSGLSFHYAPGAEVLREIQFKIGAGEMVGLIGPNGAGKSTLLHLMSGLLTPTRGRVRLHGRDLSQIEPRRRALKIGFVPQASRVFFPYTVAEIVMMGRHPHLNPFAGPSAHDVERVQWAMEVTGIAGFARRSFNQLSGGEAQRVVIARMLAQETPALVLDEPTSSLDLYYQTAVYGLLERLNRARGLTVVIVTHDINLAAEYCPRLIGLRQGRIVFDGPPEQMLQPAMIHDLYGVQAEIIQGPGVRVVRVRHFEKIIPEPAGHTPRRDPHKHE